MSTDDSAALFRRYTREGSEDAFRELVSRHAGLVYSAVQRRLGNQSGHTADVAQAVFVRLAQRARALPPDLVVPVWLHVTAVRLASNHLRSESRRAAREQTSAVMNDPVSAPPEWQSLAPALDEALLSLAARDREALLLRYMEDRDVADTGRALGISADAAQKRIARALDRLRVQLSRRGVVAGITALAACLGSPVAGAAPGGFAAQAATSGLAAKPVPLLLAWLGGIFSAAPLSGAAGAGAVLAAAALIPQPAEKNPPAPVALPPALGEAGVSAPLTLAPVPFVEEVRALLAQKLTPQEITAELDRLSKAPRTTANRLRLAAVLEQINAANAASVAALCDQSLPLPGQIFATRLLLERWCRYDAAAALDFALERRVDDRLNGNGMGIVSYLAREWAGRDLKAAAAWVAKNVNNRPDTVAADVVEKLCMQSPDEAITFAGSLPDGWVRKQVLRGLAGEQVTELRYRWDWTSATWAGLATAVSRHHDSLPADFLGDVITHWSKKDPAAARTWMEALPDGPQKISAAVGYVGAQGVWVDTSAETGGVSSRWGGINSAERADWLLSLTTAESRGSVLRRIAAVWPGDVARDWILAHSDGAERDDALRVLAGNPPTNPNDQAMSYVLAISGETLRHEVASGLYLRWCLDQPEEAAKWLRTAALPAALKSELEKLTP